MDEIQNAFGFYFQYVSGVFDDVHAVFDLIPIRCRFPPKKGKATHVAHPKVGKKASPKDGTPEKSRQTMETTIDTVAAKCNPTPRVAAGPAA
jgi:hypothetical protein